MRTMRKDKRWSTHSSSFVYYKWWWL